MSAEMRRAAEREVETIAADSGLGQYVVLRGMPTLAGYVKVAKRDVSGARPTDDGSLRREWTAANEYFSRLQVAQAGCADNASVLPLPSTMSAIAEAALEDGVANQTAQSIPYGWALVELDRLVIYQKVMDVTYAEQLKQELPQRPSDEDVVRLATKPAFASAVQSAQLTQSAFAFLSESSDLRVVETALLDASAIQGYKPRGRAAKMICVFVGMSTNYLSAVRLKGRLLLFNGSHRAYALRELGVTHAPCLVHDISQEDELDLLRVNLPEEDRELFLSAARPPLFKDYFDPRLRSTIRGPRPSKLLNIQFSVHDSRSADL